MRLVLTALAMTVLAGPATAQEPPPPDPLENLVPTPNPAVGSIQVDVGFYTSWQKGVRAKFEGKFPGPAPRLPDGKPDLSGTWIASEKLTRPQATPAALAELDRRFRTNLKDFPYSVCLPPVPAQASNAGGLWEVLHTQARLAVELARGNASTGAFRVLFVGLAAVRNAALVAPAIAQALGVLNATALDLPRRARAHATGRPRCCCSTISSRSLTRRCWSRIC